MEKPTNEQVTAKTVDNAVTFGITVVIIIILNIIVSTFLSVRFDLTKYGIHSVSKESKKIIRDLADTVQVKVFFTKNISAEYNNYRQYLRDILAEYKTKGGGNFEYEFVDDKKHPEEPAKYGIQKVNRLIIEKDQRQAKAGHFGMAFIYGDMHETIDNIHGGTIGQLEYKITSTIKKMTERFERLENMQGKMKVIFVSSSDFTNIQQLGVNDHTIMEYNALLKEKIAEINPQFFDKIEYEFYNTSKSPEARQVAAKYGLPNLTPSLVQAFRIPFTQEQMSNTVIHLGIIIAYEGQGQLISPTEILVREGLFSAKMVFNKDVIGSMDGIIKDALENILQINPKVAYITGHGEPPAFASPFGADGGDNISKLAELIREDYEFETINIDNAEIGKDVDALLIVAPTSEISEYGLYQIDQFIMQGKPVAFIVDGLKFPTPEEARMSGRMGGELLNTGVGFLLSSYGVKLDQNIVFDKKCYKHPQDPQQGGGEIDVMYIPVIEQENIHPKHPVTSMIKGLWAVKSSSITPMSNILEENGATFTKLIETSKESWSGGPGTTLYSPTQQPPQDENLIHKHTIAAVVDGAFKSAYNSREIPLPPERTNEGMMTTSDRRGVLEGTTNARIFVLGSSEVVKVANQFPDPSHPNYVFLRNAVAWLVGDKALLKIMNKGLRYNPPKDIGDGMRNALKGLNTFGLPVLVILIGLIIWRADIRRRKKIEETFGK